MSHQDAHPPLARAALLHWQCRPLQRADAYPEAELQAQLSEFPGWGLSEGHLERCFRFPDFTATMRFVNAVATLAEAQDHHPELTVGYDRCTVRWQTHSAGGITLNDFACAALTDEAATTAASSP